MATIWMSEDFSGAFGCQGGTMNNYRIKPELEPTDKYEKAKQDLLKAKKSIEDLSPEEQRALAQEVFGAARVEMVMKLLMSIAPNIY